MVGACGSPSMDGRQGSCQYEAARRGGPVDPLPAERGHGRSLIPLLAALTAIGPATSDIYLPGFPQIARELHTGASGVQLTLTASFVGIALGQLLIGPVSDRYGRKRPLIAGMVLFTAASLLCAVAPSIPVLVAARLVQGFAGGAGPVIARAVVRDLYSGLRYAQFFARLMLVFGVAPIVAPLIGTGLLGLGGWRLIFVTLAGFGALLVVAVVLLFGETLPAGRRTAGGVTASVQTMRRLLRTRDFLTYAVGGALAFAAMFAYIGGFSFVAQQVHGSSAAAFATLFGLNAAGFIAGGQLSSRLAARHPQRQLVLIGATVQAAGALLLVVLVVFDPPGGAGPGLAGVEVALFLVIASLGFLAPGVTALAMSEHHAVAGTAAALVGTIQMALGGVVAPLVGLAGSGTAVPFGIVIGLLAVGALGVLRLSPSSIHEPLPEDEVVVPPA
jgi:DHA1 family bicyclomycin/chloramphenicol resistance-like MFS transporter